VTRTFGQLFTVRQVVPRWRPTLRAMQAASSTNGRTYVRASYAAAQPSNSTVMLGGPLPSNAPTSERSPLVCRPRVSRSGSTDGRPPAACSQPSYLQESTDVTTKKGDLNYLGKYSGSGTTWNGGTQPNADWYLWVRAYKTVGGAQAWGTPLKIHTPKAPVWVGIGDSYSSGHNQLADEPGCPTNRRPALLVGTTA